MKRLQLLNVVFHVELNRLNDLGVVTGALGRQHRHMLRNVHDVVVVDDAREHLAARQALVFVLDERDLRVFAFELRFQVAGLNHVHVFGRIQFLFVEEGVGQLQAARDCLG